MTVTPMVVLQHGRDSHVEAVDEEKSIATPKWRRLLWKESWQLLCREDGKLLVRRLHVVQDSQSSLPWGLCLEVSDCEEHRSNLPGT